MNAIICGCKTCMYCSADLVPRVLMHPQSQILVVKLCASNKLDSLSSLLLYIYIYVSSSIYILYIDELT